MKNFGKAIIIIFFWFIQIFFSPAFADPLDIQILQQVITISTSATAIPTTALRGREFLMIKNIDSSKTIYLGSSTVTADETATGGDQLVASERVYLEFSSDIVIYGIVAAGTAKVAILEGK